MREERAPGLIDRLFGGMTEDLVMFHGVRSAKAQGLRTGLLSNSWGVDRDDRSRFPQLFDAVVISGEEGVRKPDRSIYELAPKRMALEPGHIVFVDDLPGNLKPARDLGMECVHHTSGGETVTQLERLFGLRLRSRRAAAGAAGALSGRGQRSRCDPRRALLEVAHVRDEQRRERRRRTDQPSGNERAASADRRARRGPVSAKLERQQPDRDQPVEARHAAQHPAGHMALLDRRPDDRAGGLERVEREARRHQLPERGRQAVSGDGQRGRGPDRVHEGDEAPREATPAHDDRAADRAEPAGREDEPQVGRRAAELVLDEQRQSTSTGPMKQR